MEASTPSTLARSHKPPEPNMEHLKQRLLRKGVTPTPKILHALRKKELQKSIRRSSKNLSSSTTTTTISQTLETPIPDEEALYRTISREYRVFNAELASRDRMVGKPWEGRSDTDDGLRKNFAGLGEEEFGGRGLKEEHLKELREMFIKRMLFDDDLESIDGGEEGFGGVKGVPLKRRFSDEDAIQFLVDKLRRANLSKQDWKFLRMMKQSGLRFTEPCMLRIVESLGEFGEWRHALSVVEWVYAEKEYKHSQSRFVYTKLLAVLGKARRPNEALQVYNKMREDCQIYPDMPAYHSIAVTLGQAGLVKELLNVIEYMKQKPSKRLKNMRHKNWDPCLDPDVVIYNALLNACIPSQQWKGVSWVLKQMRHSGVKPTETTYGLAMEVMLKSAKYDLVHKFFGKMRRSGLALKALTYKVVVRAFWEEGKVDEAVQTVRNMEERGVVGSASLYYELACCLCNKGRWQEAMLEVEKLKRLPLTKPLEVTFTGMIQSCLDGGYVHDCLSIFELMKDYCTPNIGTVNLMLKIYGRVDMFAKAKDLFEATKMASLCSKPSHTDLASLTTDVYTYSSMLEASANAHQWEYFEYVYKEMSLCNYQLDQHKHARLLVEASRAGKWHLLEHAFDTILDAGDIPDPSLFTEMICQTIFRQNYEKVFSLMKYMIHTPLQISEKQWMDVFRKSRDRIGNDELKKMLHCLENSSITSEPPVCGL
ncbi:Pentatricopeptide repeat-containing protein [Acorus calamus]|uniref:Pentatricopeptide repeat-containing protein n=1 Tax=Acorus calamus TaxID=4465 RepID=A0AAV9FCZ3_ACOCL|nr:Pentatricopeptide repeat-containing protein [Acorus calamus]